MADGEKTFLLETNVIREPLVERYRIVLAALHIKLGLMKQFMKALDKDRSCFQYIVKKMPGVSSGKLKAGILDGAQIRQLINDYHFVNSMDETEKKARNSFVLVVENYVDIVNSILQNFETKTLVVI